jgi:uncharacterized membrane protein YccC
MDQPNPKTSNHLKRLDRASIERALRTTTAAVASLLAARGVGLAESYWAVVTTVIVMQSTLGAAWDVSRQRLAGTLIGGVTAAALVTFLTPGLFPFAAGMLVMGLLCAVLPLDKSAYRFAGITLAIVMLPSENKAIWIVALHRFLEVTVGIAVGMIVTAVWKEPTEPAAALAPKGAGDGKAADPHGECTGRAEQAGRL